MIKAPKPTRRASDGSQRIWKPLLLSLLLHLLLAPVVASLFSAHSARPQDLKRQPLRLKMLFEPKKNLSGQIVDLLDNQHLALAPPQNAKYLSDQNRWVKKETRAPDRGLQAFSSPGQSSQQSSPSPSSAEGRPKYGPSEASPTEKRYDLSLPDSFLEKVTPPSPNVAAAPPSNYLPHVTLGEDTLLNTKGFRYSTFYIRMKRQIEANWKPLRIVDRDRQKRTKYTTTLSFILDARGAIENIRILRPSGNDQLDQEAVSAIAKGAPYLNPPPDLVDSDGKIREIPQINFIVTTSLFL